MQKLNHMSTRLLRVTAVAAAIALSLLSAGVWAHSGASGIIKERMEAMKSMGAAMKATGAMISGKQAYDAEKIREAARAIGKHASETVELFPDTEESRNLHISEAAPAIWEKKDDFTALALELAKTSEQLAQNARSEDKKLVIENFKAVGGACKTCHERFRIKKD